MSLNIKAIISRNFSKLILLKRKLSTQFFSNFKRNIILLISLFISIYFFYSIFHYLFYKNHFDPVYGTDSKMCPACFGNKACPYFFRGEINIKGPYRVPLLQRLKSRPIFESFRGLYHQEHKVILKRLATSTEYEKIDTWICDKNRFRHIDGKCHAKYALWFNIDNYPTKTMQLAHIAQTKDSAPMMHCATDRLYDRIKSKYRERHTTNREIPLSRPEEIMILYTLHLNQQALMLQIFPSEDGWPFPKYYGACGRWMVEEHAGLGLDEYCKSATWVKLTILINLLKLSVKLDKSNDKSEEWAVYIGDPDIENFMVDPITLSASIVDLEHMLVVDVRNLREMRLENFDVPFNVPANPCGNDFNNGYFNCTQSFDKDRLCGHQHSDHNIHTMCAVLLAPNDAQRAPNCLLSDPRLSIVNSLLNQCVFEKDKRREHFESLLKELEYLLQSVRKADL